MEENRLRKRKSRLNKAKRAEIYKNEREKSLKQLTEINNKIWKKCNYKKKYKEPTNEKWGDKMILDKKWPNINENRTLRFFGHNTNGISYKDGYFEWLLTLQQVEEYQANVVGLVELNLDVYKPEVKNTLYKKMKKYDKHAKISTASSKESYTDSPYKPGGTAVMSRGNWSGRVIESGQDSLGRWTFQVMEGRQNKKIMFISFYRVCKKNSEMGKVTI